MGESRPGDRGGPVRPFEGGFGHMSNFGLMHYDYEIPYSFYRNRNTPLLFSSLHYIIHQMFWFPALKLWATPDAPTKPYRKINPLLSYIVTLAQAILWRGSDFPFVQAAQVSLRPHSSKIKRMINIFQGIAFHQDQICSQPFSDHSTIGEMESLRRQRRRAAKDRFGGQSTFVHQKGHFNMM